MTIEEIKNGETSNIEYKVDIPQNSLKYIKTVVAFANGRGGKVIFGIENATWDVIGFNEEEVFLKADAITNAIYDSCSPKIMPEVYVENVEGKYIIVVEVSSGMQKPYCIAKLGPIEGTYIRVSGTTRVAGEASLKQLILDGTNRSFDQIEDKESIVSKEEIEDLCDRIYKKALLANPEKEIRRISENQLLSWKIIYKDDEGFHPSNAYYLLNGDELKFPDSKIQCAVFKGNVRDIFITRKDFGGPIYEQIEQTYNFVLQHINIGSRVEGIQRQDFYELPIKTIRELIANAVCHRSYIDSGNIQVALYDDRLEITSPGCLDAELTINDLKRGRSKLRNRGIAHVFRYMDIIETWGSGIPKLYKDAKIYGLNEPELIEIGDAFRVNLFRKEFSTDKNGVVNPKNVENTLRDEKNKTTHNSTVGKMSSGDRRKRILEIISIQSEISAVELANKLNVTDRTVERDLEKLKLENKIHREGSKINGKWVVDIPLK